MRGILIGGTRSGIGKTTITMAIMSALQNVAPFKIGPDYIDTKFQEVVTGNKAYNLDGFMLNENIIKELFWEKSQNKEISIIEGVMGLYDGLNHEIDNFSSAHISRILDVPVILVVDGKGLSTSIVAEIMGYINFDKNTKIVGVILNNVNSEKLYSHLKEAINRYTNIECLGYFPKVEGIKLDSRHLGLVQAPEIIDLEKKIEILREQAKKTINLEKIKDLAKKIEKPQSNERENIIKSVRKKLKGKKIGIAKDKAFSFYYNDNIELLEEAGAEIIEFSPISDKLLPENLDFLYFGGGYPENFAKELSENYSMKKSIKDVSKKIGIYAECGGFIYLTKGLKQIDGTYFDFVGLLDIKTEMKNKLNIKRFGYVKIETVEGVKLRAHEFHYSDIYDVKESNLEFKITKANGSSWECGYSRDKLLAGYPHINFYSNIDFFKKIFMID